MVVDDYGRAAESAGTIAANVRGDSDIAVGPNLSVDVAELIANLELAAGRQVDANFIVGVGCRWGEGCQK